MMDTRSVTRLSIQELTGSMLAASQVNFALRPISTFFFSLLGKRTPYFSSKVAHYLRLVLNVTLKPEPARIIWAPHEIDRQHITSLASDASSYGLGAYGFDEEGNSFYFRETWSHFHADYKYLHINDQELIAALITLHILGPLVTTGYYVRQQELNKVSKN